MNKLTIPIYLPSNAPLNVLQSVALNEAILSTDVISVISVISEPGVTELTTVLPDSACGGTEMKEENIEEEVEKGFVLKVEERETMISKEEEVEEVISPSLLPGE